MTPPRPIRPGLTQIEVIISVAIMSVMILAMTSVMMLAGQSINSAATMDERTTDARDVVQQMRVDMGLAESLTERTAKSIAFTVPDRDGDGQAESIRYAWAGQPGDPLTRTYNSQPAAIIAEDVYQFDLTYLLKTVAAPEE